MKILIIVHSLTGGGAERVAASWANGLSRRGNSVTIMTGLRGQQTYDTDRAVSLVQLNFYRLKSRSIFQRLKAKVLNPVRIFNQIRLYIDNEQPDVIMNVLYYYPYSVLLGRCFAKYKVKLIQTDHNAYERPKGHGFAWKQWRNKFIDNRFFDKVTVLTHPDKKILNKKGIHNVEVLHNPLFLQPVATVPKKEKIVLSVGRIDQWYVKGFDVLMKAWREVAKYCPDWKLRVVGTGDASTIDMLKKFAGTASESIEFVSYTPNVKEEYHKASIFVLSSRYEGWGLVMVEAMSQGCAVVACDYKGRQTEAVCNNINGLICTPDNVDELAFKIKELINNDSLRTNLQFQGVNSVAEYSEENVAVNIENLIRSIN
ncbi:glycosyltransferase [uncultured Duncaniella sp.]|uniref:glycosyltransferase n=1 Tax=uncultured Duncaniella sp. TaxID=2768039 RepID=UPI00272F6F49|nr:glycosyltransferase [uncultured Duncaniella sp.]